MFSDHFIDEVSALLCKACEFVQALRCPDLIHTPINLYEGILDGNRVMVDTRMYADIG